MFHENVILYILKTYMSPVIFSDIFCEKLLGNIAKVAYLRSGW